MSTYAWMRFSQHGTIAGGQTWSTSYSVAITNPTAPSPGELSDWLESLDTASGSWWNFTNGPANMNAGETEYLGNRAYFYPAGATVAAETADRLFGSPFPGTGGGAGLPQRTCCVSSLLTDFSGRSFRGRRYLPATAANLASHQFSSQQVNGNCSAEIGLIDAINASHVASGDVLVVIHNNRVSPPPVSTVRVDSLPDTQRRRTDKITALIEAVQDV